MDDVTLQLFAVALRKVDTRAILPQILYTSGYVCVYAANVNDAAETEYI